ncbi:hypothetical protein DAETH_48890 (plasmid) [Deinococcus aetherius]|uniref:Diguanylate cyclase n=1 Tax=Deinococcus aetherius TaxID=200252 RepID=A0ABM8AM47_9DEIO|nr:diguanylate cyclase [Deinococcus aetherius]BDP44920.1 hypothetical protein DAETH_48890 [Deinococcus aetherius]
MIGTAFPLELVWQVLEVADIGLLITDLRRHILYANETFTRETGYTLEEVQGRHCSFLQGPDTDPADVLALREALNRGEPVERVILNYRKDGSPLWYRLRIRPIYVGGVLRYFVGAQEDYSAARAAQVHLEQLAYLDSLTGLGNRRAFDTRLSEHTAQGERLAVLLLDLNGFKQVNDQRGHLAGDTLLREVGHSLGHVTQGVGSAFRLGGDEFAVLLPGADAAEAQRQRERVLAAVQCLDGGSLRVAVGSACFPAEAEEVSALLHRADQRLYAHKIAG